MIFKPLSMMGQKPNGISVMLLIPYASLWYHYGRYEVSQGKSETYSVEADNAELRHYLARLARSSRCFSRCPYALYCAVRLFVYCYNRRQLKSRQFPNYTFHLMDFVDPLV